MFVVDADACRRPSRCVRTRAEPLGIEVVVADLHADGLPDGDVVRRAACSTPAPPARSATRAASIEAAHERGALVVVAADLLALTLLEPPGELGRRRRRSADPALRRAAGLRRPARRLHGGRARASSGTLPGRLVGVSVDADGRPALPAGAADPRAAHPPREGDLQHLHRAGAAGRRWPSMYAVYHGPDGLRGDRAARRTATPRSLAAGAARRRRRGRARRTSSTPSRVRVPGPGRRGRRRGRASAASTCGWSTPTRVGDLAPTRPRRATHVERGAGARSASTADVDGARRGAPPTRCPPALRRARRRSSPTRSSTRTAPRPRCCATCAGSPTATTRSTAA